jgi:hypothetical protein
MPSIIQQHQELAKLIDQLGLQRVAPPILKSVKPSMELRL